MRLESKTAEPRYAFVEENLSFLLTSELTEPQPFDVDALLKNDIHLFICALGFEDRCTSTIAHLANKIESKKIYTGIVGCYSTNQQDNKVNESKLFDLIDSATNNKILVDADSAESVRDCIQTCIDDHFLASKRPFNILFDLSASSNFFILSVICSILEHKNESINLTVINCEAKKYFPTHDQYIADKTSTILQGAMLSESDCYSELGVQEPKTHPLYTGFQHESRPNLVIAIPSFRMNRIIRCINFISEQAISAPSSNVIWVFGEPISLEDSWRKELQMEIVIEGLKQIGSNAEEQSMNKSSESSETCCIFDYRKIICSLFNISDSHIGKNITCIPMGSKMQSLGVALALFARNEISVTYAMPTSFTPKSYSEGVGKTWQAELGNTQKLKNLLSKIGCLTANTAVGIIKSTSTSHLE